MPGNYAPSWLAVFTALLLILPWPLCLFELRALLASSFAFARFFP